MLNSEIFEIIINGYSINDVCLKIYGYTNNSSIKKIKKIIEENNIDISHFKTKNKNTKYKVIEKICPVCDKKFKINENITKITCSLGCANTYFRKSGKKEIRYKISESLKKYYKNYIGTKKCSFCGNEFERKRLKNGRLSISVACSKECSKDMMREKLRLKMKEKVENGTHIGWKSRNLESYPESFFKKVLDSYNIKYEFNKPIKKRDIGINCDSNYFLDFYLSEKNIDLEIDGKQHNYSDRKKSDKVRDENISKICEIYRIKWKSINSEEGKKYIQSEINKFLKFYNSKK